MKHEHQFWQDVAGTVNPGWIIRVDPLVGGGTGNLAGNDTFIYVVDVASGWVSAGAIHSSDAPKITSWCRSALAAARDRIPDLRSVSTADFAGNTIAECGAAQADAASTEVSVAISMTVAALQETQTFARSAAANRQRSEADMAGHWVYLAYRTKTGHGIITRPIWISSVHPGIGRVGRFLDPVDLLGIVRTVVRSETSSTQSMVGKTIAAEGGAIVAPSLLEAS